VSSHWCLKGTGFSPYVSGCKQFRPLRDSFPLTWPSGAKHHHRCGALNAACGVMGGAANRPRLRKELYRNATPDST
jgi:hypothetical protein